MEIYNFFECDFEFLIFLKGSPGQIYRVNKEKKSEWKFSISSKFLLKIEKGELLNFS